MPDWWPLVVASRALRISPIELSQAGVDWLLAGLALAEGEGMLAEYQSKPKKVPPSSPPQARTLGRA